MPTTRVESIAPWRTIGKRLFVSLNPQDPSERTLVVPAGSDNGTGGWLGVTAPKLSSGADGANEVDLGVKYVYWSLYATFDMRGIIPAGSTINSITLFWQVEWGVNANYGVPFYITTRPVNAVASDAPWWAYNPTGYTDGPFGVFPNPHRTIYDNARVWKQFDISIPEWNHEAIPYWWTTTPFFIALTPLQIHNGLGRQDQYVKFNQNHSDGTGWVRPYLMVDHTTPGQATPNGTSTSEYPGLLTALPVYVLAPPSVTPTARVTFDAQLSCTPVAITSTGGSSTTLFDARLYVDVSVGFDVSAICTFDARLVVSAASLFGVQTPYPIAVSNVCFRYSLGNEAIVPISGDSYVGVDDFAPIYVVALNTDIRAFFDEGEVGVGGPWVVLSAKLAEPIDAALFARFVSVVSIRGW